MSSPERLNVLLSRARNALIIIGNSETFLRSRKGKETWSKFFDMIKRHGHFYEGLPVRCERHDNIKNVLRSPGDFERLCPNGGCSEPWFVSFLSSSVPLIVETHSDAIMSCGIHTCPSKCHDLQNHKVLACTERVQTELPCGHSFSRRCNQPRALPDACFACKQAQRKVGVGRAAGENEAGINNRPSTSAEPRPPSSPTSPWRSRGTTDTTDQAGWRSGRSTDQSTNVFAMHRGPRQSTDTYKDGLFSRPKPQSGSSYSSHGGSNREGTWRPTHSRW